MASNVKPHQRAFALTIAIIFLVTTIATSVFVVMAIIDENKQNNTAIEQTAPAQSALETAPDASMCETNIVQGYPGLAAPEVFKPAGDVTELATTDIEVGTGDEVQAGDCLIAKYYGSLASNGEKFDENYTQDSGLIFRIGQGNVIAGWDEGVVGMKVGGVRRLVIPADKGYGEGGSGSIPPNADLVFVVKVLEIKK